MTPPTNATTPSPKLISTVRANLRYLDPTLMIDLPSAGGISVVNHAGNSVSLPVQELENILAGKGYLAVVSEVKTALIRAGMLPI